MLTPETTPLAVGQIAHLTLNVHDLDRSIIFYRDAIGFRVEATTQVRARLAIGSQRIELVRRPDASPYPKAREANDPWFQHFAIVVADMPAAYERLSRFSPDPITRGGPQRLPPSTGSVTAFKFRDPDGHPLELSHVPESSSSRSAASSDAVFLGIDHTALVVRALDASIAFYAGLGFTIGSRSLNQGPEQSRLDGLDDAVVDIVTLLTPHPGPHIELLHYRSPSAAAPLALASSDIAATQTVLAPLGAAAQGAVAQSISCLADPDGHLLRFTAFN